MRFHTKQHQFYCGIDLHARTMYLCIMDHEGTIHLHRNLQATAQALADAIQPYCHDLALAVECTFTWYWVADLCSRIGVEFVLGHALYMKAIHGGKVKNDKIDSQKIAALLRSGMLPMAYVYPQAMRSTRDLLRRRLYLSRRHAQPLTHVQNTNTQYNLPQIEKRIDRRSNRTDMGERFSDSMVRTSVQVDVALLDALHEQILGSNGRSTPRSPNTIPWPYTCFAVSPASGKSSPL